jgi:hypothetical protein
MYSTCVLHVLRTTRLDLSMHHLHKKQQNKPFVTPKNLSVPVRTGLGLLTVTSSIRNDRFRNVIIVFYYFYRAPLTQSTLFHRMRHCFQFTQSAKYSLTSFIQKITFYITLIHVLSFIPVEWAQKVTLARRSLLIHCVPI